MFHRRFVAAAQALLCALALAAAEEYDTSGPAVEFTFQYQKGDSYRILSTVEEDVFVNMNFNHHAQIVNRVSATVTDVRDGSGTLDSTFMTTEQAVGAPTLSEHL